MSFVRQEALLLSLENKVEEHLKEAIKILQNLQGEVLLQPSSNGGWSIAQCLEHLNSYGHYYLPLIQKALEKSRNKNIHHEFKSTWLGNYFTKLMDPSSGKTKFKAFKDHSPSSDLEPSKVVAEFIRQQEVLLQILHQARTLDLNSSGIPVSILKWIKLKPGDVLRFIVAHNDRHMQQAKRNL